MLALIPFLTDSEVISLIKFSNAQTIVVTEIHWYVFNVWAWCEQTGWCIIGIANFPNGRQNVHDQERSGWLSLIDENLVEQVRQHVLANCHLKFTKLCRHSDDRTLNLLLATSKEFSRLVNFFPVTNVCKQVSHIVSSPRLQTSMTQDYKKSLGMTNIMILEVLMLKAGWFCTNNCFHVMFYFCFQPIVNLLSEYLHI